MSDVLVHQLPEFEYEGYPPSIEYRLPAHGMLSEHRNVLTPWLRRFVELDEGDGLALLEARWASELDGPLGSALNWFLGYEPVSMVVQGDRSWLLGQRHETDVTESTFYLLPQPPEEAAVRQLLNDAGFRDGLLPRILVAFWGMREDFAPSGGIFLNDEEPDVRFLDNAGRLRLLNDSWMESINGYNEWQGSLFLFTGRNGDILLAHPTGKVGWWAAAENQIKPYASDLEEFLNEYARYQRESWVKNNYCDRLIHWPFDSYGTPRRESRRR